MTRIFREDSSIISLPNSTSRPSLTSAGKSKKNGELLSAMSEAGFDILLTADRNLRFQQNLSLYDVKVAILRVPDTRIKYLEQFVKEIETAVRGWNTDEDFIEIDLLSP